MNNLIEKENSISKTDSKDIPMSYNDLIKYEEDNNNNENLKQIFEKNI